MKRRLKRNPVEVAVVTAMMRDMVRTLAMRSHMLEDGEDVRDLLTEYTFVLGLGAQTSLVLNDDLARTKRLHACHFRPAATPRSRPKRGDPIGRRRASERASERGWKDSASQRLLGGIIGGSAGTILVGKFRVWEPRQATRWMEATADDHRAVLRPTGMVVLRVELVDRIPAVLGIGIVGGILQHDRGAGAASGV